MGMYRLKSLLTVSSLHTVLLLSGLCSIVSHWLDSRDRVNASALVSSRRAVVWTVIRADKRSVWHDSNESCAFVPLLAHEHYIELFISFYQGKLYSIVIELLPYLYDISNWRSWCTLHVAQRHAGVSARGSQWLLLDGGEGGWAHRLI